VDHRTARGDGSVEQLVTNTTADAPASSAVASHGPLMPCPAMVSRTMPWLSSTIRQSALAVAACPLVDGVDPTMTQPARNATSAVSSPIPPGQGPGSIAGVMCARSVRCPPGEICTMVLPVPCRLALLLKLLTRTLPTCSRPVLRVITAVP
jgi:hypothetical protein